MLLLLHSLIKKVKLYELLLHSLIKKVKLYEKNKKEH